MPTRGRNGRIRAERHSHRRVQRPIRICQDGGKIEFVEALTTWGSARRIVIRHYARVRADGQSVSVGVRDDSLACSFAREVRAQPLELRMIVDVSDDRPTQRVKTIPFRSGRLVGIVPRDGVSHVATANLESIRA
jgi:hypothetical protein